MGLHTNCESMTRRDGLRLGLGALIGGGLIDALRLACADMVDWLMKDYGFERYEALELLGQTAHLYIANVVDPQFSVACALNKKYLPK